LAEDLVRCLKGDSEIVGKAVMEQDASKVSLIAKVGEQIVNDLWARPSVKQEPGFDRQKKVGAIAEIDFDPSGLSDAVKPIFDRDDYDLPML
jgi:hypothetical protein